MFEQYTEPARRAIFFARYEASQFGTAEIPPELLLLGILRDKVLVERLLGESYNAEAIRQRIESEITRGEKTATSVDLPVSLSAKRAMAYSAEEAERSSQQQIGTMHLLIGLVREKSLASRILTDLGLTLERLREEAARLTVPPPPPPRRGGFEPEDSRSEPVTRNLVALAIAGQLGPLIGREHELERLIRILSRRTRSNAVLIGESGVGKRAIVEGLAQRMADSTAPPWLRLLNRKLLALDVSALMEHRRRPRFDADYPGEIFFIPGLFDLSLARHHWAALEAMKLLEPPLARGSIQVIATGTPAGYREAMAQSASLVQQFEVIPVLPPNDDEAAAILRGVQQKYEQFHDVTFSDEAIVAAVAASARFLRHRSLPDRALDLLDEAGAYVNLRRRESDSMTVTAQHVIEVVASRVGAPVAVIQNLIAQPDASGIERIAKQLIALVPQGREWLEPLAAYLAGCSAEEGQKLAAAIQSATEKPKE
jgi:ATP-dependent Clp protease ATP-binding subunit ClpC